MLNVIDSFFLGQVALRNGYGLLNFRTRVVNDCCLPELCVWQGVFFHVTNLTLSTFAFIRKDSRYTEKDAAVVVRQMLKVAAECHLHGLVHRDMKPEVCFIPLAYIRNMELFY